MVCSTRLILEQSGLTCCCRSQELLSRLWGGGAVGCLGVHLHRLRGPTSSPPPSITRQQMA